MNSSIDTAARSLRPEETTLLAALLREEVSALEKRLAHAKVVPMPDGGMGSVRFVSKSGESRFGRKISVAEYTDADGAVVSIAVNVDDHGELFEIDLWKVDFSPLVRYPTPSLLRLGAADTQ